MRSYKNVVVGTILSVLTSSFLGLGVGLASAAIKAVPNKITTCSSMKTGAMRILLKGSCNAKTEIKTTWSKDATRVLTGARPVSSKSAQPVATKTSAPVKAGTCSQGGKCVIGETGPGGGKVFYVAPTKLGWGRYLEAAPSGWAGGSADPQIAWCNDLNTLINTLGRVGEGTKNTTAMALGCTTGAGVLAKKYRGGGKSDWFLPSKDELKLLYDAKSKIEGLAQGNYWSSSEVGSVVSWAVDFENGSIIMKPKNNAYFVRPVRAF